MIQQAINNGLSIATFLAQRIPSYERGVHKQKLRAERDLLKKSIFDTAESEVATALEIEAKQKAEGKKVDAHTSTNLLRPLINKYESTVHELAGLGEATYEDLHSIMGIPVGKLEFLKNEKGEMQEGTIADLWEFMKGKKFEMPEQPATEDLTSRRAYNVDRFRSIVTGEEARARADASLAEKQTAENENLNRLGKVRFKGGDYFDLDLLGPEARRQVEEKLGGIR